MLKILCERMDELDKAGDAYSLIVHFTDGTQTAFDVIWHGEASFKLRTEDGQIAVINFDAVKFMTVAEH